MKKAIILLLVVLIALTFSVIYLLLIAEVHTGQQKIDQGQKALSRGVQKLDAGKARLAAGKERLAEAQGMYRDVRSIPIIGTPNPITGIFFSQAHSQLAQGAQKVAQGQSQIAAGQAKINAGKLELSLAKLRLNKAKWIQTVIGVSAIFFILLAVFLGFRWRSVLVNLFKRSNQ